MWAGRDGYISSTYIFPRRANVHMAYRRMRFSGSDRREEIYQHTVAIRHGEAYGVGIDPFATAAGDIRRTATVSG
jgi:hypothetical protein